MSGGDWKDMFYATERGDVETVRYHIRNGIDPNYQHPEFLTTALVEAVKNNQLAVVQYLLDHGAKPELKSEFEGIDGYEAARRLDDTEMLALFGLERQVKPKSQFEKAKQWFGL